MAQRRAKEPKSPAPDLEPCYTAAGMPAWRWGPEGYPYGYDSLAQEEVARQQARDNGRSMAELAEERNAHAVSDTEDEGQ